jgi:predicted ATPase
MITLIEARNFRCLRYIHQPLGPFHVLVGPHASGKSTFLDVIAFLGKLVSDGLETAVFERTWNIKDLIWGRQGNGFELAIEAAIPGDCHSLLGDKEFDAIRYEIEIEIDVDSEELTIKDEKVALKKTGGFSKIEEEDQRDLFPDWKGNPPGTIISPGHQRMTRTIVHKGPQGNANFYSEVHPTSGKGWAPSFKLAAQKSALANLPEDESKFPASTWLKKFLIEDVQQLSFNSLLMSKASPPGQSRGLKPDGSNLARVINHLQKKHPQKIQDWFLHIQTALPDIERIKTIEREDKHCYLVLCCKDGLEVPSWMASAGTLRLLALTLPAYIPGLEGVFLIEGPEKGIHPQAVETVYQSLSSVYDAQVLLVTYSPVFLRMVEADKLLCFAKTPEGETDIVRGSEHPNLKEWKGEVNLGDLFAGGVLG